MMLDSKNVTVAATIRQLLDAMYDKNTEVIGMGKEYGKSGEDDRYTKEVIEMMKG
jgi:hypothetical protein